MPSFAVNAHEKQARTFSEWVWFEGTTALLEGQGVCYNFGYGTDTVADARRLAKVEVPSVTNAQFFAGVAARKYSASATGRMIEIYRPGSICKVLVGASTVVGVGRLTCEITGTVATNGSFRYSGLEGEGSCIPMQTTTFVATYQKCLALLDGPGRPSGLLEVLPLVDNDAIGPVMVGGTTLITGSVIATGNCTYTLPNATRDGLRKKFGVITAHVGTSNFVVTVTSGRMNVDGDTTLATVTFTAAASLNKQIVLEWGGSWSIATCTITDPVIA